jgi:multidrug efflux pump subunit AcrA (membrane-fusion protein)
MEASQDRAWVAEQWISHIEMKRSLGRAVAEILRDRVKARADLKRLQAEVAELQGRLLRLQAAEIHPPYATADLFEPPSLEAANG